MLTGLQAARTIQSELWYNGHGPRGHCMAWGQQLPRWDLAPTSVKRHKDQRRGQRWGLRTTPKTALTAIVTIPPPPPPPSEAANTKAFRSRQGGQVKLARCGTKGADCGKLESKRSSNGTAETLLSSLSPGRPSQSFLFSQRHWKSRFLWQFFPFLKSCAS